MWFFGIEFRKNTKISNDLNINFLQNNYVDTNEIAQKQYYKLHFIIRSLP